MKNFTWLILVVLLQAIGSKAYPQILTNTPTVPSSHPRVFIQPKDIAGLKSKIDQPEFFIIKNRIYNSGQPILKAFTYLMEKEEGLGKKAIEGALAELKGTNAASDGRKLWNSVFKGACVYDWCYPLLTSTQKQAFQNEFARIHNVHAPFWPAKNGDDALTGHSAAGWYWNQIIAGLAIYDENPVIFDKAMKIFFEDFQESRNFYYASDMNSQGHYMGGYYTHEIQIAWLFKSLTGKDLFIPEQQFVPYQIVYSLRPDRELIRRGDVSDDTGVYTKFKAALGLTAEYYNDPYLRTLYETGPFKEYNEDVVDFFCSFLFRPSGASTKPLEELPLTKYFPEPVGGEMIARTGWDMYASNSPTAIVHMRIGQYYWGNHQHKDFGTFQVYYNGNLTGDTGLYQDGPDSDFGSSHWKNYYRATIAHNGLLIYDPQEKYSGKGWTNTAVDGGVRWPLNNDVQPNSLEDLLSPQNGYEYGKTLAFEFGPDKAKPEYSYISGDITKGYNYANGANPDRAKLVTRSMVTYNTFDAEYPTVFVVYDRVVATNPDFKKTFLLHSMFEPDISQNTSVLSMKDGQLGKLTSYTILPENASISKVGGTEKAYWINGQNYDGGEVKNKRVEEFKWRLEISPTDNSQDTEFLHVMAVMKNGTPNPSYEKIVSDKMVGAKILDRVVTFSRSGQLLTNCELEVPNENTDPLKILLCDLAPGNWQIVKNGKNHSQVSVDETGKALYFQSTPGRFKFVLKNELTDLATKD